METVQTTIYGHDVTARVLVNYGGTADVEVLHCATMPTMAGKCYRVSGLPLDDSHIRREASA